MRLDAVRLGAAALLAVVCGASSHAVAGARPRAVLFRDASGTPIIRYAFAPGERAISFADRDQRSDSIARAQFWSFDKKCFALEPAALARLSSTCGDAEVRLDWDTQARDRMYPGLVRLRNGGVLVYTGYLQPLTSDRESLADWTARAPAGGIAVFRDRRTTRSLTVGAADLKDDTSGWIYLGPDRFAQTPAARVLVDEGIAPALKDAMERMAPALIDAYGRGSGVPLKQKPTLYLTWDDRAARPRHLQADVVPGAVIRFTLNGAAWADPSPEALALFRSVTAHEMAHLWIGGIFNPAEGAAPWTTEGGAELLSVAGLVATGTIGSTAAATRVGEAFNECALLANGRPWASIREHGRGKLPYACGLALQFAVLAMARQADPGVDAFSLWTGITARGSTRYYEASVQRYFARAGQAEAADRLERLLTDRSTPLERALRDMLSDAGQHVSDQSEPSAEQKTLLGELLFTQLMKADCHGSYSFYTGDGVLTTAPPDDCASFKPGMAVRTIQGTRFLEDPVRAIAEATAACQAHEAILVATSGGQRVSVPCAKDLAFPVLPKFIALAPGQVRAALLGERAWPAMAESLITTRKETP